MIVIDMGMGTFGYCHGESDKVKGTWGKEHGDRDRTGTWEEKQGNMDVGNTWRVYRHGGQ